MANTKTDLVSMLQTAIQLEPDEFKKQAIAQMIARARDGYYHDFESEVAFPKSQLVQDLEAVGLEDISNLVREGEFDESYLEEKTDLGRFHITPFEEDYE